MISKDRDTNAEFSRTPWGRRAFLSGLVAGGASLLSGCGWDGHFNVLGYTTKPPFDEKYKTIYVPIFANKAFQTTPYRGMEMELTRAVIREIEWKSKMKVISDCNRADTELLGTIITLNKQILNRTQQNEVREGNVVIAVELVWRDLRTNKVLSNPRRPVGIAAPTELPPFDPDNPPPRDNPDKAIPNENLRSTRPADREPDGKGLGTAATSMR
jgi:hypothetical protein